jgi:hypothetical protein
VPRGLVALFALLEALFVVGIGVLVPFALGLMGWASLSGVSATPLGVWQLAVQAWALGHGIPLSVSLGDSSAVLADALSTFDLSLAPFGFAIVTLLVGRRAGRRLTGAADANLVAGLLVFFVTGLAALTLMSGTSSAVTFDVVTGTIRVVAPFVVGLVVGWMPWNEPTGSGRAQAGVLDQWRDVLETSVRIAASTVAGLVAIASLTVAVRVVFGYATAISLYESLHTGVLGGVVITVAQLALVPVAIVWAIAWMAGPGFTLGAGTVVSPFATTVGAAPAVPLLGAIPESTSVGFWVTLVPGLIALVVSARFAPEIATRGRIFNPGDSADLVRVVLTAVGSAVAVAFVVLIVGSYASGSAGPGRFSSVGIDPIIVAGVLAGGVFAGALFGIVAGKLARDASV